MDPLMGTILLWAVGYAPTGWAFCNGQLIAISQNQALFALLGTTFGGNGVTTFGLPNFQSRVPVGAGTGAGLSTYVIGQMAGVENVTLTQPQLPAHTHLITLTIPLMASDVKATTSTPATPNNVLAAPYDVSNDNPIAGYNNSTPNTTLNMGAAPTATASITGSNQPVNILQPYLCVNFIIAMQGVFPSRN